MKVADDVVFLIALFACFVNLGVWTFRLPLMLKGSDK